MHKRSNGPVTNDQSEKANPMDEMLIFYIAVVVFFICPVVIVIWALIADHMSKRNFPPPEGDQLSGCVVRSMTNDQ